MSELIDQGVQFFNSALNIATSSSFYLQLLVVLLTMAISWVVSRSIRKRLDQDETKTPAKKGQKLKQQVGTASHYVRDLLYPLINALLLGVTVALSNEFFEQKWLVQFVQGTNFLALAYLIATRITKSTSVRNFMLFILTPIIILYAIGLLDELIKLLDGVAFQLGNIEFTMYAAARTLVFGAILFWFGRISNATGQDLIRSRTTLDLATRELASKTFQIALFVFIGMLLIQVAGIDLTALVVFGGAIGVGLGFGLQQIASNFISGIIILLDRSIAIGDYIELEDGRAGTLRELSMRSATLETYDGKDIMVPNERFITTAFTNWTHNNQKQRYPIVFSVAYGTDLEKLFEILREVVSSHPQVLSGDDLPIEERPDAEVQNFGDSGIEILVEFWMEAIDDGKNRVGGDLMLMIWMALRDNGIEIPFPQHEVTIKNPGFKL